MTCSCFGDLGIHASTHGDETGRRICDLCGQPVPAGSIDALAGHDGPIGPYIRDLIVEDLVSRVIRWMGCDPHTAAIVDRDIDRKADSLEGKILGTYEDAFEFLCKVTEVTGIDLAGWEDRPLYDIAAYIAAASPSVALAMAAEIRELRAALEATGQFLVERYDGVCDRRFMDLTWQMDEALGRIAPGTPRRALDAGGGA